MDAAYPFDLSLDELLWLAGALGMDSLPLPDWSPGGLSLPEWHTRQQNGHASLLTRGLLRPSPGGVWQAERLPVALLTWIAAAPFLRLERLTRAGERRCVHLFPRPDSGLWLERQDETVHFVIHPARASLQEAALRWLDLPAAAITGRPGWELPQPLTFLPLAWRDPSQAARILDEWGIRGEQADSTLAWVASLTWVAALTLVHRSADAPPPFLLCGDQAAFWGGSQIEGRVRWSVLRAEQIGEILLRLLLPWLDAEPEQPHG